MPRASSVLNNSSGSTLVAAVLILVLLSAIGMFAAGVAYKEIQVSGNDRFYRTAFYNADGAVYGSAKLVSQLVDESEKIVAGESMDAPGITYLNSESDPAEMFLLQILGMKKVDPADQNLEFIKTGTEPAFGVSSLVSVTRSQSLNPFGGGAEFGAMSEGAGAQMVAIVYRIESESQGSDNTLANVFAEYWKLVNIPGGL
jgi:Tfp pilus assembly protein PilX